MTTDAAVVFGALGSAPRLALLCLLHGVGQPVADLAAATDMGVRTASYHLRILAAAGLVAMVAPGRAGAGWVLTARGGWALAIAAGIPDGGAR